MQSSCSYKAVLIGNGTMGQRHKRLFEEDGVEFVGIADTTAEADALFKKIVAGDISPDFAVVASPAVAHDEYVKKCIEIKLPLLVEKPVSISALAAMEYQKLALERNAFVFVGHSERYNPAIEEFAKTDFCKEMQDCLKSWFLQKQDVFPIRFKFTRTHGFSPRNRDVPVEYDLMIEFDSADDKEKFHGLIETYAKKYDDRVDENGDVTAKLLAESWWQPLYSSGTPMRNSEFQEMIDNTVYDRTGKYSIHTFTLPEGADAVVDKVGEIAPELTMSPFRIYVNPAFTRYITGEDHQ